MRQIFKKTYLLLPILSLFIISCGASNPAAPYGSTITISPSSVSVAYTKSTYTVDDVEYTWFGPVWYTQYYTIVVTDENGKPMDGVNINISHFLASPASYNTVQFYNNGERVSSPFTVKTNKYGAYDLRMDFNIGAGKYKGNIEVRSGANFGSSTFEVTSS